MSSRTSLCALAMSAKNLRALALAATPMGPLMGAPLTPGGAPLTPGGPTIPNTPRGEQAAPDIVQRKCVCCFISTTDVDRGYPLDTVPSAFNRQEFAKYPNHLLCVDCYNWKRCDSSVCALATTNLRFGKAIQ